MNQRGHCMRGKLAKLSPRNTHIICLLFLSVLPANLIAQGTNQSVSSAVVAKYMSAFQKQNIKAIIDNTYNYQREVAQIKGQNPQALWPKLIAEYYDKKTAALAQAPGYWQNYTESLMGMSGDPTQGIRALFGLVPRSSKWTITETRPGAQGTTAYVTVDYPEISEAPIAGPQLLKQTILNFTLSPPPTLVVAVQKVEKADVFWTGGPDVHTAMAKRFFGAGLWDAAISQLKPLESDNKLSMEGRTVLASAYIQHVTSQCFGSYLDDHGDSFPKLKGDSTCMADVERALALQPSLRKNWVTLLLSHGNASLQARQLDSAAYLAMVASQFVDEDPELKALAGKLRQQIASQYLYWAVYNFAHQNHGNDIFVQGNVRSARELLPNVLQTGGGLETVKQCLREASDEKARGGATTNMYFFGILDFMQAYRITIPSQEMPEFLNWADHTNSPADWEKRVRGLAQGAIGGENSPTHLPAGVPSASTVAECSDYMTCIKIGADAKRSAHWEQSVAYFQKAAAFRPELPATWDAIGSAYVASGQYEKAPAMWDKALSLGGSLSFFVCHPATAGSCASDRSDRGYLILGPKQASFITSSRQKVFEVSPSDVTSSEVSHKSSPFERNELHLKVKNKSYTFFFVPLGVDCGKEESAYCEEDQAVAQQLAVFNYISQAIPKLSSGTFKP